MRHEIQLQAPMRCSKSFSRAFTQRGVSNSNAIERAPQRDTLANKMQMSRSDLRDHEYWRILIDALVRILTQGMNPNGIL